MQFKKSFLYLFERFQSNGIFFKNSVFHSVFSFCFAIKIALKSDLPITASSSTSDLAIIVAFQVVYENKAASPNESASFSVASKVK